MIIRIVAISLVLAACGSAADSGGTVLATGSDAHEFDADDVVLRISTGGGLVPREVALSQVPEVTLMGDGRLIVVAEDGSDQLTEMVEYQLTPDGVGTVVEAALGAGLDDPSSDYGFPGVTDLPSTEITVLSENGERSVSVYGLGFDEANDFGVSESQSEARLALTQFRDQMLDVESWLFSDIVGSQPYRPEAVAVFVTGEVDDPPEGALIAVWPLEDLGATPDSDSTPFPCALVDGPDIEMLYAESSPPRTLWNSGALFYYLGMRPLLPDEAGCPE